MLALTLGCSSRPYDWSATKHALELSAPEGAPVSRALAVLDSLGFGHGQFDPRDSTITGTKREPNATRKIVFSSLMVVLNFNGAGRLTQRTAREVFTGP